MKEEEKELENKIRGKGKEKEEEEENGDKMQQREGDEIYGSNPRQGF